MSSEEEATAANVLSQMSQIQQISCETIEATVINVGHHCDVETTAPPQGWFSFKLFMLIGRIGNRVEFNRGAASTNPASDWMRSTPVTQ